LHVPRAPAATPGPAALQHFIVGFEELGSLSSVAALMHTKIAYNFCITIFEEQYVCQMEADCSASVIAKWAYPFDFYLLKIFQVATITVD